MLILTLRKQTPERAHLPHYMAKAKKSGGAVGRTWSCRIGRRVELSSRLQTSFARSYPKAGIIRLNPVLLKPSYRDLLPEILCHELAHLAVYDLFGPGRKPHGPEWRPW